MNSERSWFFKRVLIGLAILLATAQLGSLALVEWIDSRMERSAFLAEETLHSVSSQLAGLLDSSSYGAMHAQLLETLNTVRSRQRRTFGIASVASVLSRASLYRHETASMSTRAETSLVVATESFAWIVSASPAIAKIAGYSANQDIATSLDVRDMFIRLHAARAGLSASIERLKSPPASLAALDAPGLIALMGESVDAADVAIRAIDTGNSYDESLRRYISQATRAASSASVLKERLTSEPFKASLQAMLQ